MTEWLVSSAVLAAVIIALRYLLRGKLSPGLQMALWGILLLRLLMPGMLPATSFSVADTMADLSSPAPLADTPDNGMAMPNAAPALPEPAPAPTIETERPAGLSPRELALPVWAAGAAAAAVWLTVTNVRFLQHLRRTRRPLEPECRLRVYVCEELSSPCLFGFLRPAVYVTPECAADPVVLSHVLAHETAHFRHGDHLWALLRGAALSLHWFDPFVWWAAFLSRRDTELFADAGAIRRLGEGQRLAYGSTLVRMVARRTRPADLLGAATTMTGGKKSIFERVQRIAEKVRMSRVTVIAVTLLAAAAVIVTFTGAREGNYLKLHLPGSGINPASREEAYHAFTAGETEAAMELNFDSSVEYMILRWEEWYQGKQTRSFAITTLTDPDTLRLEIQHKCSYTDEGYWKAYVPTITYSAGIGSSGDHFIIGGNFPDERVSNNSGFVQLYGFDLSGWERMPLQPGESYVLAAWVQNFDLPAEEPYADTCEEMTADSAVIAENEYVCLLRAELHTARPALPGSGDRLHLELIQKSYGIPGPIKTSYGINNSASTIIVQQEQGQFDIEDPSLVSEFYRLFENTQWKWQPYFPIDDDPLPPQSYCGSISLCSGSDAIITLHLTQKQVRGQTQNLLFSQLNINGDLIIIRSGANDALCTFVRSIIDDREAFES